jgi:hypothetical protein
MAPAFEEAAKLLEPDIRLGKVNTEEERSFATRFGIVSIPTVIVFREGRELADNVVPWKHGKSFNGCVVSHKILDIEEVLLSP